MYDYDTVIMIMKLARQDKIVGLTTLLQISMAVMDICCIQVNLIDVNQCTYFSIKLFSVSSELGSPTL